MNENVKKLSIMKNKFEFLESSNKGGTFILFETDKTTKHLLGKSKITSIVATCKVTTHFHGNKLNSF